MYVFIFLNTEVKSAPSLPIALRVRLRPRGLFPFHSGMSIVIDKCSLYPSPRNFSLKQMKTITENYNPLKYKIVKPSPKENI